MSHQEPLEGPIGSGHVRAMARLGLAEIRAALYPESNIAQPTEYGLFGRETPGEVAMQREGPPGDQEPKSVLAERLEEVAAKQRAEGPRDDKSQEPERS